MLNSRFHQVDLYCQYTIICIALFSMPLIIPPHITIQASNVEPQQQRQRKTTTISVSVIYQVPEGPTTPIEESEAEDEDTEAIYNELNARQWARLLCEGIYKMQHKKKLDPKCLSAPRRQHADLVSSGLSFQVAAMLYPDEKCKDPSFTQSSLYEKGTSTAVSY